MASKGWIAAGSRDGKKWKRRKREGGDWNKGGGAVKVEDDVEEEEEEEEEKEEEKEGEKNEE